MNYLGIESNKKKVATFDQWKEDLKNVKIAKQDMNKLVMNFFLIEGYKDAAEKFKEESQTEISDMDLEFMQPRIDVRKLILNGQIDEAVNELEKINNKVLEGNKDINFNIKLQKCIEFIRKSQIDEAISFAQAELLPILEENDDKKDQYQDCMEKVMSLLAFENLQESPYKELVSNSQRIKISSQVNYEMLKGHSTEKENKLPTLIKLLLWSQEKLSEKLEYPQIKNIATAQYSNEMNGNGNKLQTNQTLDKDLD